MTRPLVRDLERVESVAEMLKALGHPLRLRIVAQLSDGDQNVNTLAEALDAAPAIVSQQLRILRMSGLVAAERTNGQAIYRITEPRIFRLLNCMESHK
jgi:ArsR family transcriptional regulator